MKILEFLLLSVFGGEIFNIFEYACFCNVFTDNCTSAENSTSPHVDVYYQEQSGFLFGSRDSVLGILFGLFGLMIILVTSYYLWRRYRTRQRRQRIRSYLG